MGSPARRLTNPITRCRAPSPYGYAGTDDGRGTGQRACAKRLTLMSEPSSLRDSLGGNTPVQHSVKAWVRDSANTSRAGSAGRFDVADQALHRTHGVGRSRTKRSDVGGTPISGRGVDARPESLDGAVDGIDLG